MEGACHPLCCLTLGGGLKVCAEQQSDSGSESNVRPWVEFSDDGTLTFRYGSKTSLVENKEYEIDEYDEKGYPGWHTHNNDVKKVVFDSSFAKARPTTGKNWFREFWKLETIEGIENLNTSEMTDMCGMFDACHALKSLDLSKFNTEKVTDMSLMFYFCDNLTSLDLSSFNTQNVTKMSKMFVECRLLTDLNLSNFDTQKVTDMSYIFRQCSSLKRLDISSFNTSEVEDMTQMFYGSEKLIYIFVGDGFTTQNVNESAYMFGGCVSLPNYNKNKIDKTKACNRAEGGYFDNKSTTRPWAELADDGTLTFRFGYKPELEDGKDFELVNATFPSWNAKKGNITKVVFDSSFAEARPTTGFNWFYGCKNLEIVEGIENLNTSEMTSMISMFQYCSKLESLNLSGFNTEKVTSMSFMFAACGKLASLDLSSFNTQNVTSMFRMFEGMDAAKYIRISDKFVKTSSASNVMEQNNSSMLVCPQEQYDALKSSTLKSRIRPYFSINVTAPYGTLCVPLGANLTEGSFSGFDKLYKIESADAESGTITMTAVTSIEPGVPYVFHRDQTDNEGIITFTVNNSVERVSEPNNENSLLKGTFEGINAPTGSYILLTDGNFHPVAAGNTNPVGAYRAYLDLSSSQSGSEAASLKTFRMVFSGGETTGIDSVNAGSQDKTIYDLTGRRVNAPLKGNLYIVNGKKVLYN